MAAFCVPPTKARPGPGVCDVKTIVFSHANSYPAGCYRVLFDDWRAAGWTVRALPQFGHNPRFPVTSNWPHLVEELLHFIDEDVRPQGPVALVGHSLGGLLSLMAASQRPGLASHVLMLDSPFISGWRTHLVRLSKVGNLGLRVPPASISLRRRNHWPTGADAAAHFRAKKMFQAWDPRVLGDYLACGFQPDPERGGVTLAFRREVETAIYAGLPHTLPQFARRLKVPLAVIAGAQSAEMRQGGLEATRRIAGPNFLEVPGSHLFPFEQPNQTAATVAALLAQLR